MSHGPVWMALVGVLLGAELTSALDPQRRVAEYSHQSYTVENGLPQNSVVSVAQTPDGYLWLATFGGLVRSDGVSFTVFHPGNTEILSTAMIYALEVADDGTLWVGTYDGLFSVRDGHFERWDRRLGLRNSRVLSLHIGREQNLWIGTYGGLARFRDGTLQQWTAEDGLTDESVWSLFEDRDGDLWIGTWVGGLLKFRDDRFERQSLSDPTAERGYWAIAQDSAGRLWLGSGHGLFLLDSGRVRAFGVADGLPHEHVQAIEIDRDGNLWLGTYGSGLARAIYDPVTGRLETEVFDRSDGLVSDRIWTLHEDREGHLWIGTLGGGVDVLREGVFVTHGLTGGSLYEETKSITQDTSGTIWAATLTGGVHRLTEAGNWQALTTADGLPTDRVWAVYGDRAGAVWVATSGAGLARIEGDDIQVFRRSDGLPHDVIFGIYEAPDGSLWLTSNGGLGRFRDGRFTTLTKADGLPSNLVRSVLVDGAGDLWIGTAGAGVCRARAETIDCFGPEHGLSGTSAWSIMEDSQGILWFGTSAGLFRFTEGRFRGITARHGLQFDNVSTVVEDGDRNLWLGTRRGILRIRRQQLDEFFEGKIERIFSLRYGLVDGLKNTEVVGGVQPAALAAADGKLWFPTLEGVAAVDPRDVHSNRLGPASRIERIVADGGELDLTLEHQELPPGTRRMEIAYTAFSLRAPHLLQFRYQLEGFDDGWVDAGSRRRVTFTNLPAGEYTFRVAARSEDGDWNPQASSLTFSVGHRFYETTPFLVACLVLLSALAVAGHRLQTLQARRRQEELSHEVERALAQVNTLSGMLPICSHCKKIRDDDGYWSQLESYLTSHSDAELTHGICPSCTETFLHDLENSSEGF